MRTAEEINDFLCDLIAENQSLRKEIVGLNKQLEATRFELREIHEEREMERQAVRNAHNENAPIDLVKGDKIVITEIKGHTDSRCVGEVMLVEKGGGRVDRRRGYNRVSVKSTDENIKDDARGGALSLSSANYSWKRVSSDTPLSVRRRVKVGKIVKKDRQYVSGQWQNVEVEVPEYEYRWDNLLNLE